MTMLNRMNATCLLVLLLSQAAWCESHAGIPPTISDPAMPMITLPSTFSSHRANSDQRIPDMGKVEIANLKGPGCVRHIWFLPGDNVRLVIHVDDAAQPQVDLPLKAFFGVMHGMKPYHIDCAAFAVMPNPLPDMPGTPGYNLYLPIPFGNSCRITLKGAKGERAVAMVDWQAYEDAAPLTPYRLHATHRLATPAEPRGSYLEMANITGEGFVAGIVEGYIQRNKSDMVFHTGGMTFLIDGETRPNAIRGHNVEDDFGFTWGFNERQSQWIGCPYQVNRGRTDQDGVFYRFFGPDPIAFHSSLILRTGSRSDDMETVVYTYQIDGVTPTAPLSPLTWHVTGPFRGCDSWEAFQKPGYIANLPVAEWPVKLDRTFPTKNDFKTTEATLQSAHGWIDLQYLFFQQHHIATPMTLLDRYVYARTVIQSDADKEATLRLALDDWALVWLNGKEIAALKHVEGLKTVRVPVTLQQGENELLIKSSNTDTPPNKRLWVIHCAIE